MAETVAAMTDERLACLTERLDCLERSHRRWKLALRATMMLLLLAGIGLGAAAPRSPQSITETPLVRSAVDELRAQRFVLVDDTGKMRALRGAATRGAVSLGLLDNDDKIRSVLIVDSNGTPRLELFGADETRRVVLSVFPNRSGLGIFGEAGRGGAVLDVVADGAASLGLTDNKERSRAGLQLRSDGTTLLNFNDASEKVRAALGVGADGAPGLGVWDKEGKRIWQAPPSDRAP